VRQLAAAAGDGLLGSVGSPGQLETSLNSGYLVGPCNSYLEGPTPICRGLAARAIALGIRRRRRRSRRKNTSACSSSVRRRAICRRSRPTGLSLSYRRDTDTRSSDARFADARSPRAPVRLVPVVGDLRCLQPMCGFRRHSQQRCAISDARSQWARDLPTLAAHGPLPLLPARYRRLPPRWLSPLRPDAAIVGLPASKVAVGALSMGRMRANKQGACR
jgi:hypothetical protein